METKVLPREIHNQRCARQPRHQDSQHATTVNPSFISINKLATHPNELSESLHESYPGCFHGCVLCKVCKDDVLT